MNTFYFYMQNLPDSYGQILEDIKAGIRQLRLKAVLSANAHMLSLYWQIGETIVEQQHQANWGDKVTERLSDDLKREFPGYERIFTPQHKICGNLQQVIQIFQLGNRSLPNYPGHIM